MYKTILKLCLFVKVCINQTGRFIECFDTYINFYVIEDKISINFYQGSIQFVGVKVCKKIPLYYSPEIDK